MSSNTKSSITLPIDELKQVEKLRKTLGAKSNVEVVRRGLKLLSDQTDREALREAYRDAANKTRQSLASELQDLDSLTDEGLD